MTLAADFGLLVRAKDLLFSAAHHGWCGAFGKRCELFQGIEAEIVMLRQAARPVPPHANLLQGRNGGANMIDSLNGVRTLACYETTASHGQVRFVIPLRSNDVAMRSQLLAIQSAL